MKTLFWRSLLALVVVASAGAQDVQAWLPDGAGTTAGFPENFEIRRQLKDLILSPLGSQAATLPRGARTYPQRSAAHRVKVEIEKQHGYVYLLFLNERFSTGRDGLRGPGAFPVAGAGAYIIKRDARDGSFVQAKIYLRDDPECFVRLFPQGEHSTLDAYLFGVPVARRVRVPLEFEAALVEPVERILRLTAATVAWERFYATGDPESDRRIRRLVEDIRGRLDGLGDREDGALDGSGRYVIIDSGLPQSAGKGLNCSGFAKWVADGFVFPLTGRYLDIEPLKRKHLEIRGNRWSRRFEDERDPYFGLDWSRNLALSLLEASDYAVSGPESSDVRLDEYVRYTEDLGYPIEELELVLYLDSLRNPGSFYLGSVNREYGTGPVLRQHFHLVVLLPFFTDRGEFRIAVFERSREADLAEIVGRFAGNFVHLVRLPTADRFEPQVPVR